MTLEQMKNIDIRTVDPDMLVNAKDIDVDMDLPKIERMKDIAKKLGNPYCFKIGDTIVKIGYSETTATIDDRFESFMRTQ